MYREIYKDFTKGKKRLINTECNYIGNLKK